MQQQAQHALAVPCVVSRAGTAALAGRRPRPSCRKRPFMTRADRLRQRLDLLKDLEIAAVSPGFRASAPLSGTGLVDSRETCFTPFSMASSMNRYRNPIDLKML